MNVSPINPYSSFGAEPVAARAPVVPAPSGPSAPPEAVRAASTELSAEAPRGTDDRLWSVLDAHERSYFARGRAMASVTYGPSGTSIALGVRGQSLNIRV